MQLDRILISVAVISMVAIALSGFLVDVTDRYGVSIDPEFQEDYDKLNETYSIVEDVEQDVKEAQVEGDSNDWDIIQTILAGINAIKNVFTQGVPTVLSMITGIGKYIPVPAYILRTFQTIFIIGFAFSLVYLYFRYKNP